MIQTPIVPMPNPYMVQQQAGCCPAPQPNYNAVKIEINNPSVGPASFGQPQYSPQYAQPTAPYYNYPEAQLYNYPLASQQPFYAPTLPMPQSPVVQQPQVQPVPQVQSAPITQPVGQVPVAPQVQQPVPASVEPQVSVASAPVISQQNINVPQPVPVVVTNTQPIPVEISKNPEVAPAQAEVKPVEVKPEIVPSESVAPQVDLNAFLAKLADYDFDAQAAGMEEIANLVKESPDKATELVDTKIFDALVNIINFDSSHLDGPTDAQNAAREKVMAGKDVTEEEKALANTITPREKAERNKSYALFTSAIIQKLYADEVKKLSNNVIPLTELPIASVLVDQLKNNPNPIVRASAVDALSYLQNSEYKKDLETVFNVAKLDQEQIVADTAKVALDRLAQI